MYFQSMSIAGLVVFIIIILALFIFLIYQNVKDQRNFVNRPGRNYQRLEEEKKKIREKEKNK